MIIISVCRILSCCSVYIYSHLQDVGLGSMKLVRTKKLYHMIIIVDFFHVHDSYCYM